jgi:amino acid adenylation domain-containing protein
MFELYTLGLCQQDVYYEQLLYPELAIYNIGGKVQIKGQVDPIVFRKAVQRLVAQHDSLRSVISVVDGTPYLKVSVSAEPEVGYIDLSQEEDPLRAADEWMRQTFSECFDLSGAALLNKYCLLKVTDELFYIFAKFHHLIADGWSMSLLFSRLAQYYTAIKNEQAPDDPEPYLYTDFIADDLAYLVSEEYQSDLNYWRKKLEGFDGDDLPLLPTNPGGSAFTGSGHHEVFIDRKTYNGIKSFAEAHSVSVFHFLLGVFYFYFSSVFDNKPLVTGLPLLNRKNRKFKNTVGLFAGVTPLLINTRYDQTFIEILRAIRNELKENFRHQRLPISAIAASAGWLKGEAGRPIYPLFFSYEKHDYSIQFDGYPSTVDPLSHQMERVPLAVYVREFDDVNDVRIDLNYNLGYFEDIFINSIGKRLKSLIPELLSDPLLTVNNIRVLSADEEQAQLHDFNSTAFEYDRKLTIPRLFERQVLLSPEKTALVSGSLQLSYSELDIRSGRIAQYLRSRHGVGRNDLVGLMLGRSEHLLSGILGILKSGGAYVPIDPDHPSARIDHILESSGIKLILTDGHYAAGLQERGYQIAVLSGDNRDLWTEAVTGTGAGNEAEDLAYVMYTSGSTGRPKGVEIRHGSVVNFLLSMQQAPGITAADRLLAVTTCSFDISVLELLLPLVSGATVLLLDRETIRDGLALCRSLTHLRPSMMQCTPGMWQMLLESGWQGDRQLKALCGGERLSEELCTQLLEKTGELWNMYGPTETTIWSSTVQLSSGGGSPVIGHPIANTQIYILNGSGGVQPIGLAGEICIGGAGLARGYKDQPELTAEKFIYQRLGTETVRLYRTGDMGKWNADGSISFLGRKDEQVKIRGYRVEPAEIEHAILRHTHVRSAAVVAERRPGGDTSLVCYVVLSEPVSGAALQDHLRGQLPDYMVPGFFVELSQLPLNANGKVDRKHLKEQEGNDLLSSAVRYEAAGNWVEQQLTGIWEEVLERSPVGVQDHFFEIGGHSLRAVQILSRIQRELGVEVGLHELFNHPRIADLGRLISEKSGAGVYEPIPLTGERPYYEVSHGQRRLWILSRFPEGSLAYNISGAYRLEGPLDRESFQRCFSELISRHESLRTVFTTVDGLPVQQIIPAAALGFRIEEYDLRASAWELESFAEQELDTAFDLSQGPLLRAKLLQTGEQEYYFLLTLHHIITDGWSMEVIVKELLMLYASYRSGVVSRLPPLRLQYRDYAHWQNEQLRSGGAAIHRAYWLDRFSGELPVLDLPADFPRPDIQTFRGDMLESLLDEELSIKVRQLSSRYNSTVFMTMLALFKVLLYKYTDQPDIIVGMPVSGREHRDTFDQVGFFVNMVALRTKLEGDAPFLTVLEKVKAEVLNAYFHQSYPFDMLVEDLRLPRDMSRSPLFDITVNMETPVLKEKGEQTTEDLLIEKAKRKHVVSKYDLTLTFKDTGTVLGIAVEYNTSLFPPETIQRMLGHYMRLLEAVVSDPLLTVNNIRILSADEEQAQLHDFNSTAFEYDRKLTIPRLFERQVLLSPEKTALVSGSLQLSYSELDIRSGRIAQYLRSRHGVGRNDLVGLMLGRSEHLLSGILGILKSGGAYVPIDPDHPSARIDHILESSGIKLILTDGHYAAGLQERGYQIAVLSGDNRDLWTEAVTGTGAGNEAEDLAYVMYTSGSTGRPKGVEIRHGSVVNFLLSMQQAPGITAADRLLAVTTCSFDISVLELLLPLVSGATVLLLDRETIRDGLALCRSLTHLRPSMMQCTPGMWQMLLESGWQGDRQLKALCGGERLSEELCTQLLEKTGELWNMYGPTETTIWSSTVQLSSGGGSPVIGHPIANTQIYILNGSGGVQPIGLAGEICIGGAGLARGYKDQPELTAEKFIYQRLGTETVRLYRTGDMGKWNADGSISFLGRKDEQVKIRGYRVEPAEIEHAILRHTHVRSAAVVAERRPGGDTSLVCYVVLSEPVSGAALQDHLRGQLPDYMVPGFFVELSQLPLNANGKVDRKHLKEQEGNDLLSSAVRYEAAGNWVEQQLTGIWEEVLERSPVGVQDHFFEIGGHSLRAVQILSRIQRELGVEVGLHELFNHPRIADLGRLISEKSGAGVYEPIPLTGERPYYEVSHGQRRLWILSRFPEGSLAYNISGAYRLEGPLDRESFQRCFSELISRHESLRTVFTTVDGLPVQQIIPAAALGFRIEEYDLRASAWELESFAEQELDTAFDLSQGPLLRAKLLQTGEQEYYFLLTLHHIITDGWSMEVIVKELLMLYASYRSGVVSRLPPLRLQYRDYAHWQNEQLRSGGAAIHRAYWLDRFSGELPVLDLPADFPRPEVLMNQGGVVRRNIDPERYVLLSELARQSESSLYTVLMGLAKALLFRYTGEPDIIVGYPVSVRNNPELEEQVGFYLNTAALRTRVTGADTFAEIIQRVKAGMTADHAHLLYPFDKVVSDLGLTRHAGRSPLFDVVVVLQNLKIHREGLRYVAGLSVEPYPMSRVTSSVDLRLEFIEREDSIDINFEYNKGLFKAGTIRLFMDRFLSLLDQAVANPGIKIEDFDFENTSKTLDLANNLDNHFNINF